MQIFFPGTPAWLIKLFAFLLGLIVGSFLNVVISRVPHGISVIRPGSRCPECKKSIRWWDNIPVLSYVFLKGRCRGCSTRISPQYPIVEIMTGFLFLTVLEHTESPYTLIARDWPFVSILVAITFIDLEHRIIPDVLSVGGLVLGLVTCWLTDDPGWLAAIEGAAIGFGLFYALAWLYEKITKRNGLGGGDIKLLAMIGAFLGPGGVFISILVSSIFGSIVGVSWALLQKKKDFMQIAIPYGPFLVIGALTYYLFKRYIWLQFLTPT